MDYIELQIRTITAEMLGVDIDIIEGDSAFIDDLGADSLDSVELVMEFEECFGFEISDEMAERITTVGDAAAVVRSLISYDTSTRT